MTLFRLQKDPTPPNSSEPVEWIKGQLLFENRVGAWIPNNFASYVRILHPAYVGRELDPLSGYISVPWSKVGEWSGKEVSTTSHIRDVMFRSDSHWWREVGSEPAQGELESSQLSVLLEMLLKATPALNEIWMLIWTGYGGSPDTIGLPIEVSNSLTNSGRKYILRKGSIAISNIEPSEVTHENPPTFWWPDDRSWFASCDIDGTSTYVGGSERLIAEILENPTLETFRAKLDDPHEGLCVENPIREYEIQTIPWVVRLRRFRFHFIHRFGRRPSSLAILYKRKSWRDRVTPRRLFLALFAGIAMVLISGIVFSSVDPKSIVAVAREAAINKLISNCAALNQKSRSDVGRWLEPMCGSKDSELVLARDGALVVGFIRSTSAKYAVFAYGRASIEAPIINRHFVVPTALSKNQSAKFSISYVEPNGAVCSFPALSAPGRSSVVECYISTY
ncbi:MAG: hypothetical protein WDO06_09505 [Actinomycetota bacterium]